jgi:transposase
MFFPEGQVRIFVYGEPVNMRLSYDGLYAKIRNVMGKDPMSGHLFAFINRRCWRRFNIDPQEVRRKSWTTWR